MNIAEQVNTQEDVATIAKEIRTVLKKVPGAVFSVTINRQWNKLKNDPHSVIYVKGMIKLYGDEATDKNTEKANLMLQGILKDVTEEYQLELHEHWYASSYTLIQKH